MSLKPSFKPPPLPRFARMQDAGNQGLAIGAIFVVAFLALELFHR